MSKLGWTIVAVVAVVVSACSDASQVREMGRVRVVIHDAAPLEDVDEVRVVFDEVSVHHDQIGWLVISEDVQEVDLKSLVNEVAETLGVKTLPVGKYSQIRLHLQEAWVIVDGERQELTVPSGMTTGIKLGHKFVVPACGEVTLTLDWDLAAHLTLNAQGYRLRSRIDVERTDVDETFCCADRLCVGGTCDASICVGPDEDTLLLRDQTQTRVSGYFGRGGGSLSFYMVSTSEGIRTIINAANGELLFDILFLPGETYVAKFLGERVTMTVDFAVVTESRRLGTLPFDERPASFSITDGVVIVGDVSALDELATKPEYALLPHLSRSLGEAGLNGGDWPITAPIHNVGRQAAADLGISLPPLPETSFLFASTCQDLSSDPNNDDCFGMCGGGCTCWAWTCGDCCCHEGCASHDTTCRNCKWYKPWNCVLCYTGTSFLWGLCASCGNSDGGFHEPPCSRIGGACDGDGDCCERHNGSDEFDNRGRTVICGAGSTCEYEDMSPAPAVCGDNSCQWPESCASCFADCGPCADECNNDGMCDGYPEDCGSCSGDCSCGVGEQCQGRACVPVCGDGLCISGEGCSNCPGDCAPCGSEGSCGDGLCLGAEDCSSCPSDCGMCGGSFCGDGACSGGETCSDCPSDCGACQTCGNNQCDGHPEDCGTCPGDCPCVTGSFCQNRQCCGDGDCESNENISNCAVDCS